MAVNIKGATNGGRNICIGTANISFADAGITADKILVIYKIELERYLSFVFTSLINPFYGFVSGGKYLIIAKQDMDLSAYCISELNIPSGGSSTGGTVIVTEPDSGSQPVGSEG